MRLQFVAALIVLLMPQNLLSIRNGIPALEREFQSAVQIWTIENNRPQYLCTGVVIAQDTVITAASCIYPNGNESRANTLFVTTEKSFNYQVPLAHALQNVAAIAKKGILDREHDIIIIFLNQLLPVEPALLLFGNELNQIRSIKQTFMVGYGAKKKAENTSSISDWLNEIFHSPDQEFGERIIAKTMVSAVQEKEIELSDNLPAHGCHGDEGSPVFAHIDTPFSNSQRLIGLVMASDSLKACEKPTRILRLDILRGFLEEKMAKECELKTRISCENPGLLTPGYNEIQIEEKPIPSEETVPSKDADTNPEPQNTPEKTNAPPQNLEPDVSLDAPPSNAKPKTHQKRRLSATAEGVGCSCQQVFTGSN